ncbi:MAG: protein-L-isoaspartate(D-aspartate) O-methyltransferase [Spirochaetales bacterium]|nr:protein-L-isoaspartate(D-aspartate) O-methyltransferase [Spirochaetales bacterium]
MVDYPDNAQAEHMVKTQIRSRGIHDAAVLNVMRKLPRHLFISGKSRDVAYGDYPISIGHGQTISQPYIVAYMTQALHLKGDEKVLEIGTGSGYQTAVLATLCKQVYTVEVIDVLLKNAERLLNAFGYTNIKYKHGDGSKGWPEHAPFDRIIVTAAAETIPVALKKQLSDNGILVIPVGDYKRYQDLLVVRKIGDSYQTEESIGCRFVPLMQG